MIDRAQLKLPDIFVQETTKSKPASTSFAPVGQIAKEVIPLSIFSFLFGMASINGLHPFALSFAAANFIYRNNFIIPAVFSYLGTLTAIKSIASIRYLGAIGMFFIIYTLLNRSNRQNQLFLLGIGVFAANVVAGLIFLRYYGISPYDVFLLLAESGMASIMTFIIPGGMPWLFKESVQPTERNICMAVLAGVILSIARNFVWLGVNVRDVLGVFAVLLLALIDGAGAGAATGIIIGITGFSFSLSPWSTAVMAFSGLIAGSFNKLGKIGIITGFSLGYLLYNFYVNSMGEAIIPLPVLAVAFLLILFLPQNTIDRLRLYLSSSSGDITSFHLEERARNRLYELATLLKDLGEAFKNPLINDESRVLSAEFLDLVCGRAQLEVCSDCGMRRICWEKEPKRTMASFYTMIKLNEGLRGKKDLPFLFKSRCGRTESIKRIIKQQSEIFKVKQQMENIVKTNQELIQSQFDKTADMVKALADGVWEEVDENIEGELSEPTGTLEVSVGVAGVAKEGQRVSGDGFSFMEFKGNRYMLALCDGMGVGKKAAQHSEKTLALLERLLEAGYNQETALKVTNSAMMAINTEEGFSTIDVALIDTVSGKIKFIKAGAPASFIKRGKNVDIVQGGSLPVGIMDDILPKAAEKTVRAGDMVIMVTDGVIDAFSDKENGEEMLNRFLLDTKTTNPQELAEKILKKAKNQKNVRDDMTVLVGSIWRKRQI